MTRFLPFSLLALCTEAHQQNEDDARRQRYSYATKKGCNLQEGISRISMKAYMDVKNFKKGHNIQAHVEAIINVMNTNFKKNLKVAIDVKEFVPFNGLPECTKPAYLTPDTATAMLGEFITKPKPGEFTKEYPTYGESNNENPTYEEYLHFVKSPQNSAGIRTKIQKQLEALLGYFHLLFTPCFKGNGPKGKANMIYYNSWADLCTTYNFGTSGVPDIPDSNSQIEELDALIAIHEVAHMLGALHFSDQSKSCMKSYSDLNYFVNTTLDDENICIISYALRKTVANEGRACIISGSVDAAPQQPQTQAPQQPQRPQTQAPQTQAPQQPQTQTPPQPSNTRPQYPVAAPATQAPASNTQPQYPVAVPASQAQKCEDVSPNCALNLHHCQSRTLTGSYVQTVCQRSCGLCDCIDTGYCEFNIRRYPNACQTHPTVIQKCKRSCRNSGVCGEGFEPLPERYSWVQNYMPVFEFLGASPNQPEDDGCGDEEGKCGDWKKYGWCTGKFSINGRDVRALCSRCCQDVTDVFSTAGNYGRSTRR